MPQLLAERRSKAWGIVIRVTHLPDDPHNALPADQAAEADAQSGDTFPPILLGAGRIIAPGYVSARGRFSRRRFGEFVAFCADEALQRFQAIEVAGKRFREPFTNETRELEFRIYELGRVRAKTHSYDAIIKVDRGLAPDAVMASVAHEIFHRIQYAYNRSTETVGEGAFVRHDTETEEDFAARKERERQQHQSLYFPFREGTARLAEDMLYPSENRDIQESAAFFNPRGFGLLRHQSGREHVGPTYETALFWRYFADQHGTRRPGAARGPFPDLMQDGADAVIHLLETVGAALPPGKTISTSLFSIAQLRAAQRGLRGFGAFDRLLHLETISAEERQRFGPAVVVEDTTWGNFQVAVALNAAAVADTRFRLRDRSLLPGPRSLAEAVTPAHTVSLESLPEAEQGEVGAPVVFGAPLFSRRRIQEAFADAKSAVREREPPAVSAVEECRIVERRGWQNSRMLPPFSMIPFRVVSSSDSAEDGVRLVRLDFVPGRGLKDPLLQVIVLDRLGRLDDLVRLDGMGGTAIEHVVAVPGGGSLLILVSSREHGGDFSLAIRRHRDCPLLRIGSWNGMPGKSYTQDPGVGRWLWVSDDIRYDARADSEYPLSMTVHNVGTADAWNLDVQMLFVRRRDLFTAGFTTLCMKPDPDSRRRFAPTHACQADRHAFYPRVGCERGSSRTFRAKAPEGTISDYVVMARVWCRDDPNRIGKTALSCFGGMGPPEISEWSF